MAENSRYELGNLGRPAPRDSLVDVLDRVLDKGVVIAGDVAINLLDIELLTIKIRLVIASVDKAKEMGIDWWQHDPQLNGKHAPSKGQLEHLQKENADLRRQLAQMESRLDKFLESQSSASGPRVPQKARG